RRQRAARRMNRARKRRNPCRPSIRPHPPEAPRLDAAHSERLGLGCEDPGIECDGHHPVVGFHASGAALRVGLSLREPWNDRPLRSWPLLAGALKVARRRLQEAPMPATDTAPITDWLATQGEAMLALLEEVVNIDSGSYDK